MRAYNIDIDIQCHNRRIKVSRGILKNVKPRALQCWSNIRAAFLRSLLKCILHLGRRRLRLLSRSKANTRTCARGEAVSKAILLIFRRTVQILLSYRRALRRAVRVCKVSNNRSKSTHCRFFKLLLWHEIYEQHLSLSLPVTSSWYNISFLKIQKGRAYCYAESKFFFCTGEPATERVNFAKGLISQKCGPTRSGDFVEIRASGKCASRFFPRVRSYAHKSRSDKLRALLKKHFSLRQR